MTTQTPAQADEKALWARYVPEWGCMKLCAKSDFGAVEYRLAAIRPEDEAVAWLDDGSTRNGSHGTDYRVVTAATKAGMPKAAAEAYTTPLFVSPPAPAGLKGALAILDAHEATARERADKLYEMDLPATDPGLSAAFAVRNKLIEIGEEIRSSLLPSSPEAQAGSPAEALPSQTSGAGEKMREQAIELRRMAEGRCEMHTNAVLAAFDGIIAALAKPASEPASGGVRDERVLREAVEAAKVAEVCAILATRYDDKGNAEGANWKPQVSYRVSAAYEGHLKRIADALTALSSPASSSPAEAEALPDGVDVEALTYRVANAKLGEGPSVRCEGPTDFEKDQARAWVRRVLAALSPAPAQAALGDAGSKEERS